MIKMKNSFLIVFGYLIVIFCISCNSKPTIVGEWSVIKVNQEKCQQLSPLQGSSVIEFYKNGKYEITMNNPLLQKKVRMKGKYFIKEEALYMVPESNKQGNVIVLSNEEWKIQTLNAKELVIQSNNPLCGTTTNSYMRN